MKIFFKCTSLLLLLCLCALPLYASAASYHWYCQRTFDHSPPPLASDLEVIRRYAAYYRNENVTETDKVIYLTFDAGYDNGNVARIAEILHEHQAHAAFFILENLVKTNPTLIQQLKKDGHLLCNHTARHRNMSKITDETAFRAELQKMEDCYRAQTGTELDKFYRPPEGTFSESNLAHAQAMGYTTVFWSFAYADWDNQKQPDPKASLQKLLAHLHNGEILLLHPTSATNAAILSDFLKEAKAQGYRFGSLTELCQS